MLTSLAIVSNIDRRLAELKAEVYRLTLAKELLKGN